MEPDTNFPNRPTEPEFDRISRILIDQDNIVGPDVDPALRDIAFMAYTNDIIPIKVLMYVATQRALRVLMQVADEDPNPVAQIGAAWVDAFMAGVQYERSNPVDPEA